MELRIFKNKKGFLRIIEIAFASALVFTFLVFLSEFKSNSPTEEPRFDNVILKTLGEDSLRSYDLKDSNSDGLSDLRDNVFTGSWGAIGSDLNDTLPLNIGFTLYQFDRSTLTFRTGISEVNMPTSKDLVSVNYILAGHNGSECSNGLPCSLNLVLWFTQ